MEVNVYRWDARREEYYNTSKITDEGINLHGPRSGTWFLAAVVSGDRVYQYDPDARGPGILIAEIRGNDIYVLGPSGFQRRAKVENTEEVKEWNGTAWVPYAQRMARTGWPLFMGPGTRSRMLAAAAATMLYFEAKPGHWFGHD